MLFLKDNAKILRVLEVGGYMEAWPVWGVIGIILIAIEMFTPTLFFLNLAFAAILTGVISFYTNILEAYLLFCAF